MDISSLCECGEQIEGTIDVPMPNFVAEKNKDSGVENFDQICCKSCNTQHEVYVVNTFDRADCSVNYGGTDVNYGMPYFSESDEMVDKDMITVKINMNVYDPYFVRADSKSTDGKATGVFKPTLTRVMAHELGHIKNYVDTGKTDYKHKAITYENTIMRELDDNSILRHPSARHGGGFAD